MTNRDLMQAALKKVVFPYLQEQGFDGKYPHYRRKNADAIELITFQANKWGGSFGIEISVAFPERKKTNIIWWEESSGLLTVWHTTERYRLPGMFDGAFFYSDVYEKTIKYNWFTSWRIGSRTDYIGVISKDKAAQWISSGYQCIQCFDNNTPTVICKMIIEQMDLAYVWMKKFEQKNKLYL